MDCLFLSHGESGTKCVFMLWLGGWALVSVKVNFWLRGSGSSAWDSSTRSWPAFMYTVVPTPATQDILAQLKAGETVYQADELPQTLRVSKIHYESPKTVC